MKSIKLKKLLYRSLWYKKNFYYLKSGQSLASSVSIAKDCENTVLISDKINDGLSLSHILDIYLSNIYSNIEISFIKVAEKTGNIDNIFLILSDFLKNQYQQKQKLINAFIYPIIVLCMTVSLMFMILFFIIPKIAPLFKDIKNLPIITNIIISLSNHLINNWYLDLFFIFILSGLFIYFKDNDYVGDILNKSKLLFANNTPYIKDMYIYWYIEKWLKIILISINSGITISDALLFAYDSLDDKYFKSQFERVYKHVHDGNTCASGFDLLDKNVYRKIRDWQSIIDSGEKTGKLKDVFDICHRNMQEDLNNAFDNFQRMIEPLLIIFVGLLVLIICISIILPMYQLTQSLQ